MSKKLKLKHFRSEGAAVKPAAVFPPFSRPVFFRPFAALLPVLIFHGRFWPFLLHDNGWADLDAN
jgi:hypothetical protein